eukprot:Hpha_TRINITY_DN16197_c3_g2::TRINITY_DN16197_c3_g2_i1::g.5431::m.5431
MPILGFSNNSGFFRFWVRGVLGCGFIVQGGIFGVHIGSALHWQPPWVALKRRPDRSACGALMCVCVWVCIMLLNSALLVCLAAPCRIGSAHSHGVVVEDPSLASLRAARSARVLSVVGDEATGSALASRLWGGVPWSTPSPPLPFPPVGELWLGATNWTAGGEEVW